MGPGAAIGDALVQDPRTAGVTFTGSYETGMHIIRTIANGKYSRPCIAEMGGKNAGIVTASADLERAASGIVRSGFGMGGQKCSALSRLYVQASVADELIDRVTKKVAALGVGDPTRAENWLGPVVSEKAQRNYITYIEQLRAAGANIRIGGRALLDVRQIVALRLLADH